MATKHKPPAPHHHRPDGGIVPKGKQKNAAGVGPDGKNRRALGDIGNLVTTRAPVAPVGEGKPPPQVSRPITRSFGAQLITNAQAAAAASTNSKPLTVTAVGGAAKKAHIRETKQNVSAKPKPEVVIDISSPNTNDAEPKQRSSRKKVHTMTSVLTARSKAAAGITDRPKEPPIPDIDASDVGDQLAVVDYIEDIYKFYKISERSCRPHDYMGGQPEINAKMRAILADWLIEVHAKFELMPESLYLTFNILDRYLSTRRVLRRELQLVGVSAMLIACKYEEVWAPEINDFICISDRAYSREQMLGMEKEMLNALEWSLTVPTPYVFLVRFLKAAMCDRETERMVFFFAELGLMQYSMVTYCPSLVAASAVYAARCTLKKRPLWTETLRRHTGFSETKLLECAGILVKSHAEAPQGKLKFVYRKYSALQMDAVALNPPATELLEELKAAAASASASGSTH